MVAVLWYLAGLGKYFFAAERSAPRSDLPADASPSGESTACGRIFLVLLGSSTALLCCRRSLSSRGARYSILCKLAVERQLRAPRRSERLRSTATTSDKAVKIAAHSHIIEFGLLSMLWLFFSTYVNLHERWSGAGARAFARIRASAHLRAA